MGDQRMNRGGRRGSLGDPVSIIRETTLPHAPSPNPRTHQENHVKAGFKQQWNNQKIRLGKQGEGVCVSY